MSKEVQFRQGDVLITRCQNNETVEGLEEIKPDKLNRIVLAEGEVTGHAHALPAKHGRMFQGENNPLLQVTTPTSVVHEEHGSIPLEPGLYTVTRQREYSPQGISAVAD
jgi:hypothetical protein